LPFWFQAIGTIAAIMDRMTTSGYADAVFYSVSTIPAARGGDTPSGKPSSKPAFRLTKFMPSVPPPEQIENGGGFAPIGSRKKVLTAQAKKVIKINPNWKIA